MSEVFIPLGGAGGKNRGSTVYMDENYTHLKMGDTASMALPLPAGVYKKFKPERADDDLPESITSSGDGKNAVIVLEDKLLKKMTLEAFGIASITNFRLSMYAHRQVRLTWAKPSEGLWSGVHFVFKYGSMPTDENDGFMFYDSADVHYETPKLEERELFVRAYSYVTVKDGRWYDDGAVSARITVSGISGSVTLSTGAGVWTVPDNVYKIRYILVGHGGKGGRTYGKVGASPGGGGGYFTQSYMNVTPGQKIPWIIPKRTTDYFQIIQDGRVVGVSDFANGQTYEFAEMYTKLGDNHVSYGRDGNQASSYDHDSSGGDGGSGGGGGFLNGAAPGAPGGSDGSDGVHGTNSSGRYSSAYARGGTGQHTSTRGFNGVLYSGGGGGGSASGGAGGGGDGFGQYPTTRYDVGKNGVDGLGGGGGGGIGNASRGSLGGTGCIYIAWGSLMNDGS